MGRAKRWSRRPHKSSSEALALCIRLGTDMPEPISLSSKAFPAITSGSTRVAPTIRSSAISATIRPADCHQRCRMGTACPSCWSRNMQPPRSPFTPGFGSARATSPRQDRHRAPVRTPDVQRDGEVSAGAFDRELEELGAESNASTWLDWTHYDIAIPASGFERVVELESERMDRLVLRAPQVASEKEVVMNERRYRVEDDVEGALNELLWSTALSSTLTAGPRLVG